MLGRIVWFGVWNGPAGVALGAVATLAGAAFLAGRKSAAYVPAPLLLPPVAKALRSAEPRRFAGRVGNVEYYWK